MAIEQSIFTCCRARRETGTTGFGYYSETAGMEELRKNSQELSMLSSSYSAPRNQELWWSNSPDETERNASEKAAVAEHHPISFGYRIIEVAGEEKAVFTYGKNLGRDIQGFRPGNILVNTVAAELSDVEAYPFEYFDSPEIFVGYDRDFFAAAPDTPAADIERPSSLTVGGSVTREDVKAFLAERPERAELLVSMLQFVLDYNDPDQVTRQVMICDKKENMILWTAALSLVFPKEIAKRFSFCTYSFLGSVDSGMVSLENTMLCGVYSASVNGDPEDRRATNYDFELESERIESALFDFERGFFTEAEPRCSCFAMILRGALMGSYEQLEDYHRFIMEETSCREIDNYFAKGSSYYLIMKFRNQVSLSYLADAADFARRFMDETALRALLETAYDCTLAQGEMSGSFADIMALSASCIKYGAAEKEYVYGSCLSFLKNAFLSQSLSRDEYLEAKERIKSLFDSMGDSFEAAFIDALDIDTIAELLPGMTKKWIVFEIAGLLCQSVADSGGFLSDEHKAELLTSAVGRAVESEESGRAELIRVFCGIFPEVGQRVGLADAVIAKVGEASPAYDDLIGYIAGLLTENIKEAPAVFSQDKPYKRQLFAACTARLIASGDFDRAIELFSALTSGETEEGCSEHLMEMIDAMLALADDDDCETAAANVYRTFEFAADRDALGGEAADSICSAFVETLIGRGVWYMLTPAEGDMLEGMFSGGGSDFFMKNGMAHNIFAVYCAVKAAEQEDGKEPDLPCKADSIGPIDFSLVRDEELTEVSAVLTDAIIRRSILCKSALSVRLDRLFEREKPGNKKIAEKISEQVFLSALNDIPKELRAKLSAEMLMIMWAYFDTDLRKMGGEIYSSRLKPDDISACFDSKDIYEFVRDHGGTGAELKKIASLITEGYDAKKQNGVFGKLRSRFGRGKNG